MSLLKAHQSAQVSFARSLVANNQAVSKTLRTSITSKAHPPSPSPSHKSSGGGGGGGSNTGAIAGGVVGGIAALVIIGLIIWYVLRRRKRQPKFDIVSPRSGQETSEMGNGFNGFATGTSTSATRYSAISPASPPAFEKRMPDHDMDGSEPSGFEKRMQEHDTSGNTLTAYANRMPEEQTESEASGHDTRMRDEQIVPGYSEQHMHDEHDDDEHTSESEPSAFDPRMRDSSHDVYGSEPSAFVSRVQSRAAREHDSEPSSPSAFSGRGRDHDEDSEPSTFVNTIPEQDEDYAAHHRPFRQSGATGGDVPRVQSFREPGYVPDEPTEDQRVYSRPFVGTERSEDTDAQHRSYTASEAAPEGTATQHRSYTNSELAPEDTTMQHRSYTNSELAPEQEPGDDRPFRQSEYAPEVVVGPNRTSGSGVMPGPYTLPDKTPDLPYHVGPYFPPWPQPGSRPPAEVEGDSSMPVQGVHELPERGRSQRVVSYAEKEKEEVNPQTILRS